MDNNDIKKSKKYLKIILNNKKSSFYDIANIKLIEILVKEKKYKKSIIKINKIKKNNKYKFLYEELKGDLYNSKHKNYKAKQHYLKSIKLIEKYDNKSKKRIKFKIINIREYK